MKSLQCMVVVFLAVCISTASAFDTEGYYGGLRAGRSMLRFNEGNWSEEPGSDVTSNYNREDDDSVISGGLFIGRSFGKRLRLEAEYATHSTYEYKMGTTNDGTATVTMEMDSHRLMALGYFDFINTTKLTPFICLGAGAVRHDTDYREDRTDGSAYTGSQHNTRFAWTAGTGLGYKLAKQVALEFTYRFVALGSVEWYGNQTGGSSEILARADIEAQELLVGVRFSF